MAQSISRSQIKTLANSVPANNVKYSNGYVKMKVGNLPQQSAQKPAKLDVKG